MTNKTPDKSGSSETAPAIEGFRVLEKLGHGATSSVWKAEQVSLNRLVVIKVLSERLTHEPEDVTLFKAEARLAANFKHSGIVQVYDFGQSKTGHRYYFVMEYISGYSVGDWIRRKGRITEHEALVVAQAVADALKYAWDLSRIVHCDIKPDNIMVDGDGSIKVADLGLAHTVKSMVNQPGAEADEVIITGTPNYMAPEQVRGAEPIDCRTDIYALGATLYHMVTGQLPFAESPPDIVMERQLKENFADPQKINPDLSASIAQLILKMAAKDPAARFQTWDEALVEIVRLERQMRNPEAVAAHAAPAPAPVERPPAAVATKENAPAGAKQRFFFCLYCGKQVQPQALFCGFCGKSVTIPAKGPVEEDQKQVTIRLKPIQENAAAPARQYTPPPMPLTPPMPLPLPGGVSRHWYASWGGNINMLLSLGILAFIGYYTYQKIKYDNDVIIPIKAAVIRVLQPLLDQGRRLTDKNFTSDAESADDQFVAVPVEKSASDEKTAPAESSQSKPAQESESSSSSPAAATVPETTEMVVSAESTAPTSSSETPLPEVVAVSEKAPVSEKASVSAKPSQETEWDRLLALCKQQQPKVGERVAIKLNKQQEKIEVILDRVTADGIRARVSPGFVEYPFRLMSEESRLLFFPEERARQMQLQKSP